MNQQTDEMRHPTERRVAIAGYNGCLKAKNNEFCLPCVVQATEYAYKGESDRRRWKHDYSPKTPYGEALTKAIAEGADEYSFAMGYRCALDMFAYQTDTTRYEDALREARDGLAMPIAIMQGDLETHLGKPCGKKMRKAFATINSLLGDKS